MNGKTNASGSGGSTGISIPLEAPTNLALSAEDSKISLTWTDPNDKYTETYNELVSQWSYDSLVRKQGSAPTSINDGTLVAKITGKNQYQNIPYIDTGMENDKEWFYSVFAHNQFNTPSDPIYGSDIPTANIITEYVNALSLPFTVNGNILTGANSSYYIVGNTSDTNCIDSFNAYNTDLIRNTISILDGDTQWAIGKGGYAKVGNNVILPVAYTTTAKKWYDVWIDPNLIVHHSGVEWEDTILPSWLRDGHGIGSVNNEVAYQVQLAYPTYNNGPRLKLVNRIDSNMIYSNLSVPSYESTSALVPLSSSKYVCFTGFYVHDPSAGHSFSKVYPYFLFYNVDGTRNVASINNLKGTNTNSTNCGTKMIFFKSVYNDTTYERDHFIYAFDETLVHSQLDGPVDVIGFASSIIDAQSIGVGITFTYKSIGSGMYSTALQPTILDLNFIYRNRSEIFNAEYLLNWYPITPIARVGNLLFTIFGYNVSSDYDYKIYVIKNGYESDIEGG